MKIKKSKQTKEQSNMASASDKWD
jgi:hypothetical protein